jgi:hypothetical protein
MSTSTNHAKEPALLTKSASRITVDFEIEKVKYGYSANVTFGEMAKYVEIMDAWFRLGDRTFFAFTRKGLLRKIETARKRAGRRYSA